MKKLIALITFGLLSIALQVNADIAYWKNAISFEDESFAFLYSNLPNLPEDGPQIRGARVSRGYPNIIRCSAGRVRGGICSISRPLLGEKARELFNKMPLSQANENERRIGSLICQYDSNQNADKQHKCFVNDSSTKNESSCVVYIRESREADPPAIICIYLDKTLLAGKSSTLLKLENAELLDHLFLKACTEQSAQHGGPHCLDKI